MSARPPESCLSGRRSRVGHDNSALSLRDKHPDLCLNLNIVSVAGKTHPDTKTAVPKRALRATVSGLSKTTSTEDLAVREWAEYTLSRLSSQFGKEVHRLKPWATSDEAMYGGIDGDCECRESLHVRMTSLAAFLDRRVDVLSDKEWAGLESGPGTMVISNPAPLSYDPVQYPCEHRGIFGSSKVLDCHTNTMLTGKSTCPWAKEIKDGTLGLSITPKSPHLMSHPSYDYTCTVIEMNKDGTNQRPASEDKQSGLQSLRQVYMNRLEGLLPPHRWKTHTQADLEKATNKLGSYSITSGGKLVQPFSQVAVVCNQSQPTKSQRLMDSVKSSCRLGTEGSAKGKNASKGSVGTMHSGRDGKGDYEKI